jgi:hypothetical protein
MFDEIGCIDIGYIQVDNYFFCVCISPFISMECPSLPNLINVGLKFTLSKISIATPACFQRPLVGKSSCSLSS